MSEDSIVFGAYLSVAIILFFGAIGWVMNFYKAIAECDYQSPYKCEVVRIVGVPFAPMGAIAGYLNLKGK